ncbi:Uncharacterized protein APZ42_023565 [Daphnia magna]|uniref:Uncharacterized protein n=1 Tax=Daphnia magna TaxID=35525 RepID=A0A0P6CAU6_9CRUS|nr:Uncharacterized protein APZ42_023565 [Daphnia magna]
MELEKSCLKKNESGASEIDFNCSRSRIIIPCKNRNHEKTLNRRCSTAFCGTKHREKMGALH